MADVKTFKRGLSSTSLRNGVQLLIVVLGFATAEPTPNSLALGAVMSVLGECCRLAAAGYGYRLGAFNGRGPYQLVRHPYFFGSALLLLGFVVAGRDPYVLAFTLVSLTWIYSRDMQRDEVRLSQRLGHRFPEYRDAVPAFFPQLIPAGMAAKSEVEAVPRFSLRFAVLTGRHRELDAILLGLLAFGLLVLATRFDDRRLFHLLSLVIVVLYLVLRFIYYGFYKKTVRRS